MKNTLIKITPENHDVVIELAYATSDNFTGKAVYSHADCYLHIDAEKLLRRAVDLARSQHLRLKIFDAFRPSEAQWVLWNHTPDADFLADPRKGSPHSKGVALDVTLIDDGGNELYMGTSFDTFSPLSHHANINISPAAQHNRFLLIGLMTSAGWDFYHREWWHYQLFNSRDYAVMDDDVLTLGMM